MKQKQVKLITFGIVLIFILLPSVFAVSIMPAKHTINFEPNANLQFGFHICGATSIRSYLEGALMEYATIIDSNQDGGCRDITVKLALPAEIETPGKNRLLVGAMELVDASRGGVAARTKILAPIDVFVPYPGYYIDMNFVAPNVNEGEIVPFSVFVTNQGTYNIELLYATIDIYDDVGLVKSLQTNRESLVSKDTVDLFVDMSTAGMPAGTYRAVAKVYFDTETKTQEKPFNIGSLFVRINNHTTEIYEKKINKFDIDIESRWNNPISDVYGEVIIDGRTVKTPDTILKPWEKQTISAYYDTKNLPIGEYDVTLRVHYEDASTTKNAKVFIIDYIEPIKEPEEQEPFKIDISITPTTLLIAVIILLVLIDVVWLVMRKKK